MPRKILHDADEAVNIERHHFCPFIKATCRHDCTFWRDMYDATAGGRYAGRCAILLAGHLIADIHSNLEGWRDERLSKKKK